MATRGASQLRAVAARGNWSLSSIVALYAVFLIAYLPLETGLLSIVPGPLYWVLRLLPDAVIVLLALGVVGTGDRGARTLPVRLLWLLGAVCLVLVVGNAARSIGVVDSINSLRVIVRYTILGLLVWWALEYGRPNGVNRLGPLIMNAILLAGVIVVFVTLAEVVARLLPVFTGRALIAPSTLLFLHGSLARYDQLGLWLTIVIVTALATGDRLDIRRLALAAVCLSLLYLTTTRQAMVALALVAGVSALLLRTGALRRLAAVGVAAIAVVFIALTPSRLPPAPSSDPGVVAPAQPGPLVSKSQLVLSMDPKKNFRLFYNLDVAPWAAETEPLFGFGPRQHIAPNADPRLKDHFAQAGIDWSEARRFTNDSNYASLVVQFGIVAPTLYAVLLVSTLWVAGNAAIRRAEPFAVLAVLLAGVVIVAAAFGPALEIRQTSVVLWVCLMTAVAGARRLASS